MTTNELDHSHSHGDAGAKSVFGFWVFILSDCILFAVLFCAYTVLKPDTFGGAGIKQVASLGYVFLMTLIMLTSALTSGFTFLSFNAKKQALTTFWMVVTFILGLAFFLMTYHELAYLVQMGDSWQRSAFLSAFFTLIGVHALHLVVGLFWMIVLMIQLQQLKTTPAMQSRLACLGLFWNFLTIIWMFIFIVVYLMGAI